MPTAPSKKTRIPEESRRSPSGSSLTAAVAENTPGPPASPPRESAILASSGPRGPEQHPPSAGRAHVSARPEPPLLRGLLLLQATCHCGIGFLLRDASLVCRRRLRTEQPKGAGLRLAAGIPTRLLIRRGDPRPRTARPVHMAVPSEPPPGSNPSSCAYIRGMRTTLSTTSLYDGSCSSMATSSGCIGSRLDLSEKSWRMLARIESDVPESSDAGDEEECCCCTSSSEDAALIRALPLLVGAFLGAIFPKKKKDG
eukprot:jgi/Mesvir1/28147/Mv26205-RA.1